MSTSRALQTWRWPLSLLVLAGLGWSAQRTAWLHGAQGRAFAAASIVLLYVVFCVVTALRWRRAQRALSGEEFSPATPTAAADVTLIAFASQTGFAEQLALQTARTLHGANLPVRVVALGKLDAGQLRAARRLLLVVSTTGEGDAPDSAMPFAGNLLTQTLALAGLRYGLLALGDRSYAQYCAFGRSVEEWLLHEGAHPLFDTIEVDNGDQQALEQWQRQLAALGGRIDAADWGAPRYDAWQLQERILLNPGSVGAAVYQIGLTSTAATLDWQAGDIAIVAPRNPDSLCADFLAQLDLDGAQEVIDAENGDRAQPLALALQTRALPFDRSSWNALKGESAQGLLERLPQLSAREYSIASLPSDGRLQLVVRQAVHPDGRYGAGSGWLTRFAGQDEALQVRIRGNRSFHAPADDRPLILIGNGTGIAGLRAHLKLREQRGHRRNWLLFGERHAAHDALYRDELQRWVATGFLPRLDLAYSRDAEPAYVQDKLRLAASELRTWVDEGAAIYICGSLTGMAAGVAQALEEILGKAALQALSEQGRYCRDVY